MGGISWPFPRNECFGAVRWQWLFLRLHSSCFECHNIHTKSHDSRFRHLSNIKVIMSTVWEAVILVLVMGTLYDVCL
jgi:hypothetical protein